MKATLLASALLVALALAACTTCRCREVLSRYDAAPFGVFDPLPTTVCVAPEAAGHRCLVAKPAEAPGAPGQATPEPRPPE